MAGADAEVEPRLLALRPVEHARRVSTRHLFPVFVCLALAGVLRLVAFGGRISGWVWVGITACLCFLAAISFAYVGLRLRNDSLVLTTTSIGRTDAWGRTRWFARGRVKRIASVAVRYSGAPIASRQWLFLDRDGRPVLTLNPTVWDERELARVTATLNVPVDELSGRAMSVSELTSLFPAAVLWWQRHVTALAIAGAIALIAAISIILR